MLATMKTHRQSGETLVGLVVGLGLGLLVLAAGTQMLAHQLRGHRWQLQDSHVHHDLRAAMSSITQQLRQAQATEDAWKLRTSAPCPDAFCDGAEDFSISDDRINFSIDRNRNGLQDNNECLGFRLSNGELKARTSCEPEVWTSLTDVGSLKITQLQWQVTCAAQGRLWQRWITVRLTAQWPGDASRQWQASQTITLRNALPALQAPAYCSGAI
jgi:type II secretory pathway component PulJ